MGRLFGTDGIRGVANVDLRPTLAFALGRAVAHGLAGSTGSIVVGHDTRRSCDMFVAAIAAGAMSMGTDVHGVGVIPTPGLAFLAGDGGFAAGVMVSASHNPAEDNGLKVLASSGQKLPDEVEDDLEELIWRSEELGGAPAPSLGRSIEATTLVERYIEHRSTLARSVAASGLRIVLDCANGAGSQVGPRILRESGAEIVVINDQPDGSNINVRSGATAPEPLAAEVVAAHADLGFALDGDADRLVGVDARGEIVDGDRIMGILALDRLARGTLPGNVLVVSILSNGGLGRAVEAAGGRLLRTPVGDKYILEGMEIARAGLGGEKSGHVIVREHSASGDGLITAVEVLRVMTERGRSLRDLASEIPMFPQEQRAVRVHHKDQWEGEPAVAAAVHDAEQRLGPSGRVLVRPSGTEPVVRVMVEGEDAALVAELADAIAAVAKERLD
jgi:phosphoglucosamine mutase